MGITSPDMGNRYGDPYQTLQPSQDLLNRSEQPKKAKTPLWK